MCLIHILMGDEKRKYMLEKETENGRAEVQKKTLVPWSNRQVELGLENLMETQITGLEMESGK